MRRLRRALRRRERAADGRRGGDELVAAALLDARLLDGLPAADVGAARRIASALAAGLAAAVLDPAGRWAPGVTAELVLWHLWSGLGVASAWRALAIDGGPAGARADQHLDALVALFAAAASYEERLPGAGPEAFLEQVLAQEVAGDSLAAHAPRDDVVEVLTPQGAAGREWDLVVVAGLQEGVWPDLRLRGSLLGSEHLVDIMAGRGHGPREALAAVRSDEARLLAVAVSRARRTLVATAVASEDDQPSAYLDVIAPPTQDERPVTTVGAPLSLAGVVADLRRQVLTDDPRERATAASRLARLARAGVPGADPSQWWSLRRPTSTDPLHAEGALVPVSPSRIEGFGQCRLMWLLRSHGGDSGDRSAADLGTLVHEIAATPDLDLTDDAALRAELDRRWPELETGDGWRARHDHDRAVTMLGKLSAYARAARDEGWEVAGVEVDARAELGRALLTGRVDRLERDRTGALRVIDLKTGRTAPTDREIEAHPQLAAYQAAVEAGAFEGDGRSAGAALLQLGGDRKSYRLQPQAPVSADDDPGWARRLVEETAEGMAGTEFPATPGPHCSYCPVRSSCPAQPEGRSL